MLNPEMNQRRSLASALFHLNPPGFVPSIGQGLVARESQLGAVGTKNWLKEIKLHKYWPMISHWSYWQMMSLTESNIDYQIELIGGTGMTRGAQGKLLRCIQQLRERHSRLLSTVSNLEGNRINLKQALSYISWVVKSPMPTSEVEQLPTVVVYAVLKVLEHARCKIFFSEEKTMNEIDNDIRTNPILAGARDRLSGYARSISLALEKHTKLTSMIANDVMHQKTMNCSVDSGFDCFVGSRFIPSDDFSICPQGIDKTKLRFNDDTCYEPIHKGPVYRTFRSNNISEDKDSFRPIFTTSDKSSICPWDINETKHGFGDDTCYKDSPIYKTFKPINISEQTYFSGSSFTPSDDLSTWPQGINKMMVNW